MTSRSPLFSSVILGIYQSILGDDIFCTLECIESNKPYYTTLMNAAQAISFTTLDQFETRFDPILVSRNSQRNKTSEKTYALRTQMNTVVIKK